MCDCWFHCFWKNECFNNCVSREQLLRSAHSHRSTEMKDYVILLTFTRLTSKAACFLRRFTIFNAVKDLGEQPWKIKLSAFITALPWKLRCQRRKWTLLWVCGEGLDRSETFRAPAHVWGTSADPQLFLQTLFVVWPLYSLPSSSLLHLKDWSLSGRKPCSSVLTLTEEWKAY